MKCAWQAYLNILPHRLRQDVDNLGRAALQELRLRVGLQPELILTQGTQRLNHTITNSDLSFVINVASNYSPWAAATTARGYLTAEGGHRIGMCGACTIKSGTMTGIQHLRSLCIRVARDFNGISKELYKINNSILILGPPGSGKTTLLRDLIRMKSNSGYGNISVVDEREELFPFEKEKPCFVFGERTDILSGSSKATGINCVLRNMNPEWIAVDEITAEEDCNALLHAGWCGVKLIATAHAGSVEDLLKRPVYKSIVAEELFSTAIVMKRDKSWSLERIRK